MPEGIGYPEQAPQGAPQQAAPGGGDVMKEMASLLMEDAQKYAAVAEQLPPEVGEQLMQLSQAIGAVVQNLGVVPKGKGGGEAVNPDVAGTNAQPVDPRMG